MGEIVVNSAVLEGMTDRELWGAVRQLQSSGEWGTLESGDEEELLEELRARRIRRWRLRRDLTPATSDAWRPMEEHENATRESFPLDDNTSLKIAEAKRKARSLGLYELARRENLS